MYNTKGVGLTAACFFKKYEESPGFTGQDSG